jgi:limonene-1,2-epoxide hydrolase
VDAFFKDPFNEVTGVAGVRQVYAHMFDQLSEPSFSVLERWEHTRGATLAWELAFRRRREGAPVKIRGMTHLRFAPDGRISYYRDYWDAAEELYAKLPVLGGLMRFLQRRLRA